MHWLNIYSHLMVRLTKLNPRRRGPSLKPRESIFTIKFLRYSVSEGTKVIWKKRGTMDSAAVWWGWEGSWPWFTNLEAVWKCLDICGIDVMSRWMVDDAYPTECAFEEKAWTWYGYAKAFKCQVFAGVWSGEVYILNTSCESSITPLNLATGQLSDLVFRCPC